MSKLLDRFRYFKQKGDSFANGHGQVYNTNRDWEDSYRQRWQFDKIVRSTHGVNCTGSCSWKIYVKNGLVTWETQQTDYPRTPLPYSILFQYNSRTCWGCTASAIPYAQIRKLDHSW